MTRRNGTAAYLRFCGREARAGAGLRAGLTAARRGAAAFAFAAAGFRRAAGAGVVPRAVRAVVERERAAALRTGDDGFGEATAAGDAARLPSDACGARWTSVKRIWSPTA